MNPNLETPIMLDDHLTCLSGAKKLSNRARPQVRYPHTVEILDAGSSPVLTFTVQPDTVSWSWDEDIEDGNRQIMGRSLTAKLTNADGFTAAIELKR